MSELLAHRLEDVEILWNLLSEVDPLFKNEYIGQINVKMRWSQEKNKELLGNIQQLAINEIKDYNGFNYGIGNYYRSDDISRNSKTMGLCSQFFIKRKQDN